MSFEKLMQQINRRLGQLLKKEERTIARQYSYTLSEIRKTLSSYYEKYEIDGKLTLEEMLKFDRRTKLLKEIDHLLKTNHKTIYGIIMSVLKGVYTDGFHLTAWAVERYAKAKIGFSAVRPETLTAMLNNPIAGLTLNQRLEKQRADIIYTIQQQVTQGLQNNETYSSMAKRLKSSLEGDAVKSMRIVRTEGHRVQESAKLDAVTHAHKNGVIMVKEWNTLEDSRVRRHPKDLADHTQLNNKRIPVDELFDDGLSKGLAPGQLPAAASSINCRCFLTYSIDRVEKPQHAELEKMAFDTWMKERMGEKSENLIDDKFETPIEEMTLSEVEDEIRNNDYETGFIYDKKGRQVWIKEGDKDSVKISDAIKKGLLKGNVYTHNHPNNMTFSKSDVLVLVDHELDEMRAVSKDYNYSIKATDKMRRLYKEKGLEWLSDLIDKTEEKTFNDLQTLINRKQLTVKEAEEMHGEVVWNRFAKSDYFIYRRDEINGQDE